MAVVASLFGEPSATQSAGSSPRQPNSGTVHPGHLTTTGPALDGHSRSCVPAG